ncbi:MAG: MBOAT family O-acyltransferase [Bacteroidota bacterium]|nr:MBOAT family O-acyltransferase [Bacteroidota bacterium]
MTVIIIDYFSGIAISNSQKKILKKIFLGISISSNLLILFFFKYFNFFIENIEILSGNSYYKLNVILPIGLSFHTFQSLSYVIEVYRGNHPPEKRFDVFALYVLFFPQLVAGPIERPQNIIHQIRTYSTFNYINFINGLKYISLGLIKKCVLADRIGIYVDDIYANINISNSYQILLVILLFSLQIYFDFSGYSDIAIGSAKCLGINLMQNFNLPYMAKSLKEFWTRWHISLSRWFKDYVFIPLGGNRESKFKHFINIMAVFLLSGLWHGASWNFVIWGALHGLLLYISSYFKFSFNKKYSHLFFLDVAFNFIIVSVLWVFFRSPNFNTTFALFNGILNFKHTGITLFTNPNFQLYSLLLIILGMLFIQCLKKWYYNPNSKFNISLLIVNFIFILTLGIFSNQSFIYFQF